jgi:alanine racemase
VGNDGDQQITATELAARAGTIAWDIFTGIGQRVQRFHHDSAVN